MGMYVDSKTAYLLYQNETKKPYFVDKSMLLKELFPLIEEGGEYICITRPRRFGKTVMANMISAFFNRSYDSADIFENLQIAEDKNYKKYQNHYPVIHIPFNDLMQPCLSYEDYIGRLEKQLIRDLRTAYPEVNIDGETSAVSALLNILAADDDARFVFVLDEWDFIFHQSFATEENKKSYLMFLRNLLRDRPYVLLAYMTGILPIAKYSSGSELNMFLEYTMATEEKFSRYFGFTEEEVDLLFDKYCRRTGEPRYLTRSGLKSWYDGYYSKSGISLYNPRSVVTSLKNNNFGNYWSSSGPYDEIYYYIENNVSAVRDDLAVMAAGNAVSVKVWEYAATSMKLQTKEEIFSAMVVYGFLTYRNGKVSVPNRELMDKFTVMLRKEPALGYVYRLAKESPRMLKATLSKDTDTMAEILSLAHDTEVPLLSYNNETGLTAVVNLVYLAARDYYRVEREGKAGRGYADFIFYPEADENADCIILELKIDSTPKSAIRQIKDKNYALKFKGRLGERTRYSGRILAVGISYDRKKKEHSCKIEELL